MAQNFHAQPSVGPSYRFSMSAIDGAKVVPVGCFKPGGGATTAVAPSFNSALWRQENAAAASLAASPSQNAWVTYQQQEAQYFSGMQSGNYLSPGADNFGSVGQCSTEPYPPAPWAMPHQQQFALSPHQPSPHYQLSPSGARAAAASLLHPMPQHSPNSATNYTAVVNGSMLPGQFFHQRQTPGSAPQLLSPLNGVSPRRYGGVIGSGAHLSPHQTHPPSPNDANYAKANENLIMHTISQMKNGTLMASVGDHQFAGASMGNPLVVSSSGQTCGNSTGPAAHKHGGSTNSQALVSNEFLNTSELEAARTMLTIQTTNATPGVSQLRPPSPSTHQETTIEDSIDVAYRDVSPFKSVNLSPFDSMSDELECSRSPKRRKISNARRKPSGSGDEGARADPSFAFDEEGGSTNEQPVAARGSSGALRTSLHDLVQVSSGCCDSGTASYDSQCTKLEALDNETGNEVDSGADLTLTVPPSPHESVSTVDAANSPDSNGEETENFVDDPGVAHSSETASVGLQQSDPRQPSSSATTSTPLAGGDDLPFDHRAASELEQSLLASENDNQSASAGDRQLSDTTNSSDADCGTKLVIVDGKTNSTHPYNVEAAVGEKCTNDNQHESASQTNTQSHNPATSYTCTVCGYTCAQKFHFNSHMNTHADRKCTMCDYTSRTEGRLRKHMSEAHLPQPPDDYAPSSHQQQFSPPSPDGCSVDTVDGVLIDDSKEFSNFKGADGPLGSRSGPFSATSSSKPKNYKCKQCQFIAPSKDIYWEHQRTHIKPDRLLTCPDCPFVTEYKHHMEYHRRNHSNVKPYKCSKCNYRCVNKSMLNSHMKSHSSVYQYRCLDCSYETKYVHSLKQHLRKHKHRPGKHVNQEGVEEEIELDIYGNRRGPKMRKKRAVNLNVDGTRRGGSQASKCSPMNSTSLMSTAAPLLAHHQQPSLASANALLADAMFRHQQQHHLQRTINGLAVAAAIDAANGAGGSAPSSLLNVDVSQQMTALWNAVNAGGSAPAFSTGEHTSAMADAPQSSAAAAFFNAASGSAPATAAFFGTPTDVGGLLVGEGGSSMVDDRAVNGSGTTGGAVDNEASVPSAVASMGAHLPTVPDNLLAFVRAAQFAAATAKNEFLAQDLYEAMALTAQKQQRQLEHCQRRRSSSIMADGQVFDETSSYGFEDQERRSIEAPRCRSRSRSFLGISTATPDTSAVLPSDKFTQPPHAASPVFSPSAYSHQRHFSPTSTVNSFGVAEYPPSGARPSSRTSSRDGADIDVICRKPSSMSSRDDVDVDLAVAHAPLNFPSSPAMTSNTVAPSASSRRTARKGRAFKFVDSIAERLHSRAASSSPVPPTSASNVDAVNGGVFTAATPFHHKIEPSALKPEIGADISPAKIRANCFGRQGDSCDEHPTHPLRRTDGGSPAGCDTDGLAGRRRFSSSATPHAGPPRPQHDDCEAPAPPVPAAYSKAPFCQHCAIWFLDPVMYQMHRGYHSNSDPFTCNSCGVVCETRLKFYLHLNQAAHE